MHKMCTFHFEMHKTADLHLNVSWELVAEGYQGRPMKRRVFEKPLPGMVILWLVHWTCANDKR